MAILTQSRILAFALLATTTLSASTATFKELHPFSRPLQNITVTSADTNGQIYGVSSWGGPYGDGAIFHVNTAGSLTLTSALTGSFAPRGYSTWIEGPDHTFWSLAESLPFPGSSSSATLQRIDAQGIFTNITISDPSISMITFNAKGQLFGLAQGECYGGQSGKNGKLYSISTNGDLTLLICLNGCDHTSDLFNAHAYINVLTAASDGNFYHFGQGQSSNSYGIYKISTNGEVARVASFQDEEWPSSLVDGPDGLYGTTYYSTLKRGSGTIFRLGYDGKFSTLTRLPLWLGQNFSGALFPAKDGLYGATIGGGLYGNGALFKIDFTGRIRKTLYLKSPAEITSLTMDAKGILYGSRVFYNPPHGPHYIIPAREEIFSLSSFSNGTVRSEPKILHSFIAQPALSPYDGFEPSHVQEARDHAFYWIIDNGQAINKMTRDGHVNTTATLTSSSPKMESLFQDSDGTFFGLALNVIYSPTSPSPDFSNWLYRMSGNRFSLLTPLASWSNNTSISQLLQNPNGRVYATVSSYLDNTFSLIELNSKGAKTLCNAPGSLVATDTNGLFYFVSYTGGDCGSPLYRGTADGHFTNIACVPSDPNNDPFLLSPDVDTSAPFVCGSDGNLYGFYFGDTYSTFKVTAAGDFVPLTPFPLGTPYSMVAGPDGNFYGVTSAGGDYDLGTVFQLTPDGTVTILHHFNLLDGANPLGLIVTSDKKLLGWTQNGGSQYGGNIFTIEGLFSGAGH